VNNQFLWQLITRFTQSQDYRALSYKIYQFASRYVLLPILASLGVTGILIILRQLGYLQGLELANFDLMVQWQPEKQTDSRLLLVEITEKDIQKYKEIPLSDEIVARILAKLQKYDPQVIGLDLYRDIPHPPGSELLKKQLQKDNVILITELDKEIPSTHNVPESRLGFNDIVLDSDNVVRRNFMYTEIDGKPLYSFAMRLCLRYLADQNLSFQKTKNSIFIGTTEFKALNFNSGNYEMKKSEAAGWQILLKYHSEDDVARKITIDDVLEGNFEPNWIKEKIILIGTTAPSEKDLFLTPYEGKVSNHYLMSGVMIHAQMLHQLLSSILDRQNQFWFWQQWQEYIWIFGWSVVGGFLAWRLQRLLIVTVYLFLIIIVLTLFCFLLFVQGGWIPFIPAILGLISSSLVVLTYKVVARNFHDPLTGLPNREFLSRKLQQISQNNDKEVSNFALISLDINRFKIINETLGYRVGDQFLVKIVERLKSCLSPFDIVTRLGGNEFVILIQSLHDLSEVNQIAEIIKQNLSQPFSLNGQEIFTTVSMGIVFHQNQEKFVPEELIRNAHTAMNRAKTSHLNQPQIFVTGMHTQAISRLQLETDLRQAIKQQEFELYYQPIINLQTENLSGFEALVRWNSPTRGFISPADFIPLAEETGLIIPLGEWILREACQQMKQWHCEFPQLKHLMISINLSSRQFAQPNLVEMIEKIIVETGIDPQTLKLEITESMVMDKVEETNILLSRLKALGLYLSIDDFGTGYSSLSYLHHFPLDILKVDRSFVKTINDQGEGSEIARTIIMLGKNLGMELIAEGIETETQKEVLQNLNCQYGQGYFFSRPLPKKDITAMLKQRCDKLC
jgi:diguanylate cyclase (GGDEF)-like protein